MVISVLKELKKIQELIRNPEMFLQVKVLNMKYRHVYCYLYTAGKIIPNIIELELRPNYSKF